MYYLHATTTERWGRFTCKHTFTNSCGHRGRHVWRAFWSESCRAVQKPPSVNEQRGSEADRHWSEISRWKPWGWLVGERLIHQSLQTAYVTFDAKVMETRWWLIDVCSRLAKCFLGSGDAHVAFLHIMFTLVNKNATVLGQRNLRFNYALVVLLIETFHSKGPEEEAAVREILCNLPMLNIYKVTSTWSLFPDSRDQEINSDPKLILKVTK